MRPRGSLDCRGPIPVVSNAAGKVGHRRAVKTEVGTSLRRGCSTRSRVVRILVAGQARRTIREVLFGAVRATREPLCGWSRCPHLAGLGGGVGARGFGDCPHHVLLGIHRAWQPGHPPVTASKASAVGSENPAVRPVGSHGSLRTSRCPCSRQCPSFSLAAQPSLVPIELPSTRRPCFSSCSERRLKVM